MNEKGDFEGTKNISYIPIILGLMTPFLSVMGVTPALGDWMSHGDEMIEIPMTLGIEL